jgi:phosphatidylserine/phosphatidylglycerophosphate/cardiolipin synthase-like enzyme
MDALRNLFSCKKEVQKMMQIRRWLNYRTVTLIGLLLSILCIRPARCVEVYFSPGNECEDHIVSAIEHSNREIMVDVYSINNRRIVHALEVARSRGVKIRILTDRIQAKGRSSKVFELINAGLNVRVNSKNKIEHNKYGVFDDALAINGSYNWTQPASEVNSENCAVMPEANVISKYQKRFEELWNLNTDARSKAALEKLGSR